MLHYVHKLVTNCVSYFIFLLRTDGKAGKDICESEQLS